MKHELLVNVKLTKKDVVRENFHYTLIKNFNALAHNVLHNTLTIPKKKDDPDYFYHICRKCLIAFTCKTTYTNHNEFCKTGQCGVKLPLPGSILSSNDYMQRKYMSKHPIVGFLDFESILEPINEQAGESTVKTQIHKPSSFGLYFVTDLDITNKYTLYRGEDVMENLMNTIKDVAKQYLELSVKFPICPVLTQEEESKFKNAKYCCICNKWLNGATYITKEGKCMKDYRVRHHCHFTNKFIGAAHTICNLANSVPDFIPIYAHNSSNYDSHFLIKNLNKYVEPDEQTEIDIVPKTAEEYLSVTKSYVFNSNEVKVRFLDSCKFLPVSLDTLSSNLLEKGKDNFNNLLANTTKSEQDVIFWTETKHESKIETHINQNFDVKFKQVDKTKYIPRVKGIFPYDYIDSFSKYNETSIPDDQIFL